MGARGVGKPEGDAKLMGTGCQPVLRKRHRLKTCATGAREGSEGLPVPGSRRCFLRAARMAKRRKHRASEGQDARNERPAMGMGSPEPKANQRSTQVKNLCYWGHTGCQPVLRGDDHRETRNATASDTRWRLLRRLTLQVINGRCDTGPAAWQHHSARWRYSTPASAGLSCRGLRG